MDCSSEPPLRHAPRPLDAVDDELFRSNHSYIIVGAALLVERDRMVKARVPIQFYNTAVVAVAVAAARSGARRRGGARNLECSSPKLKRSKMKLLAAQLLLLLCVVVSAANCGATLLSWDNNGSTAVDSTAAGALLDFRCYYEYALFLFRYKKMFFVPPPLFCLMRHEGL